MEGPVSISHIQDWDETFLPSLAAKSSPEESPALKHAADLDVIASVILF